MSRMMRKLHLLVILSCLSAITVAQPGIIPAPPSLAASGYILLDAASGRVLVEHNADEQLPPASLTKMMTSYVLSHELAAGRVANSDVVTVSENSWAQNPVFEGSSLMWIEPGKPVLLEELHKGVVISSGNDASVAVAEHLAGSEDAFADLMNQHAELLGMQNTYYINSHGLPAEGHYTSARDLALLARATIENHPEDYALYAVKEFTYNQITQTNRNRLLWRDASVDGLKTGHTQEAGYCLVASAKKSNMRLISVVMGASSQSARERETQKLLAYGFRFFETYLPYAAGTELTTSKVWSGMTDELSLGVASDVLLTVPRGRHKDLEAVMNVDSEIQAPVILGAEYGELVVSLDGNEVMRQPLVALETIEQGSIFKRLWHMIILFVLSLVG
ncbi:MAG: serine hydrolase [Pseudomonadales bacterium]